MNEKTMYDLYETLKDLTRPLDWMFVSFHEWAGRQSITVKTDTERQRDFLMPSLDALACDYGAEVYPIGCYIISIDMEVEE